MAQVSLVSMHQYKCHFSLETMTCQNLYPSNASNGINILLKIKN